MKKLLLLPILTVALTAATGTTPSMADTTASASAGCKTRGLVIYGRVAVSCKKAKRVLARFDTTGSAPSGWSCRYSGRTCIGGGLSIDSYSSFQWR